MRIVLTIIAFLFLAFSARSQVLKSAGVWYFLDVDSMTARPAVLPNGTELAYIIGTKTVYYWNRNTSTWTAYGSTFNRDSIYFDSSIIGSGTLSDPWRVDSTLFATITAVGDSIAAALSYVSANYFPIQGGTLTGIGGAGYVGFPSQVSAPGTPASGLNVYAQGSSFNWKGTDGYERQFASTLTGGRTYTLPDVSGTFALGTGTTNRVPLWTATNTLGSSNIQDNNTAVSILNSKPFALGQWTTAGRPTGVTGYKGYNTTTGFEEGYFTSQWENFVTSTGASANQVAVFSNAGKISGSGNYYINTSASPSRITYAGGFIFAPHDIFTSKIFYTRSIHSDGRWGIFAFTIAGTEEQILAHQGGATAGFTLGNGSGINNSGLSGSMNITSTSVAIPVFRVAGRGASSSTNHSHLQMSVSNTGEYTEGSSYPSGSHYYSLFTNLQGIGTATNTGQNGVRAGLNISARYIHLNNDQGVVIQGSAPSYRSVPESAAALNINYSNRGFLPPRGSSTANIGRGIASVTITNGGSGYGTGAGVVITISGGGGASAAIGLTYTSGVVTAGTVILKGTGYTSAPTITISGGTGTGATATCTLEDFPDGLQFYNTTTKTPQYWETTTSSWRDYGSYQSGSLGIQTYTPARPLHVAGAARITGSAGTATAVMGRDANGDISNLGLSGLSIISGVLTATGSADGNGIYTGSGTLSQHTTRALIPSTGNLFFSQKFNSNADSAYFNIMNYLGGERAVNFGLTDTSSTGYSRGYFESDGAGSMNWGLQTSDVNGNTTLKALDGELSFTTTAGNISLNAPVDQEVITTGLVRAKQEAYYEINSTSSPQNLSNTYSDNFINQGSTQATFTLVFPASPKDGQVLKITYNNNISALTLDGNGNTIVGTTVTTAVEGTQRVFKFYAGEGVWIRQN